MISRLKNKMKPNKQYLINRPTSFHRLATKDHWLVSRHTYTYILVQKELIGYV